VPEEPPDFPSEASYVERHIICARLELGAPYRIVGEPTKLEFSMDTRDRFVSFAAECEAMAKISVSRENKAFWNSLAQRWLRCAQLTEKLDSDLKSFGMRRRQSRSQARSLAQ
jgi:hypothetical protein